VLQLRSSHTKNRALMGLSVFSIPGKGLEMPPSIVRRAPNGSARVAGLVVVLAAGLVALAPATASAEGFRDAHVYVQAAKRGELGAGRLTLHGVRRRVTWAAHPGQFGDVNIKRLHRLLFTRRTMSATGTLYVPGQRGGEPVMRLSRPRYNASRATVSYRARPLDNTRPRRPAAPPSGGVRRFGAASLSIVGAPQVNVGRADINECSTRIYNATNHYIQLVSFSTWDTDNVYQTPTTDPIPSGDPTAPGYGPNMMTWWWDTGPPLRGCQATAVFKIMGADTETFTVNSSWPWGSDPNFTCTPPPGYKCVKADSDIAQWEFWPAS
jgi:hypothetical protein